MLEKAFSTENAKKLVADFFLLKKKAIIDVSINNNNSVGKILERLAVQKQVCDQRLPQKTVCGRKASATKEVNDQTCVKIKRDYDRKKTLFFVMHCRKILFGGKDFS